MSITLHAELEQLSKLGEISDSKDAACDPFSSQSPYPIDPASFFEAVEIADALIEGTPQGEEIIDFSKPILRPTEGENACECGGRFDEDNRCDSCDRGHQDCSTQECLDCLDRMTGKAEDAYEGER